MTPLSKQAVVLLSGGLDSATTLAIAQDQGFACHAISFDYRQRHRHELDAAKRIASHMGVVHHQIVPIDLRAFGGSALTDDIDVPKDRIAIGDDALTPNPSPRGRGVTESEIPITYVPARNLIFLSLALGYAEANDIRDLFIGVNAIDYSGYPDCRPDFIESFERTANLATRLGVESGTERIRIHTPLVNMSKAQIIRRGTSLDVDYSLTVSCYDPQDGRPCEHCDSCLLRAAGFAEAGVVDPVIG